MIEATKTGSPQEIAESLRDIAGQLEALPSFLVIKIECKTEVIAAAGAIPRQGN